LTNILERKSIALLSNMVRRTCTQTDGVVVESPSYAVS